MTWDMSWTLYRVLRPLSALTLMKTFISERHPYIKEATLASQLFKLFPRQPESRGPCRHCCYMCSQEWSSTFTKSMENRGHQSWCGGKVTHTTEQGGFIWLVWSCCSWHLFVWGLFGILWGFLSCLFISPTFPYPSAMDLGWEQPYSAFFHSIEKKTKPRRWIIWL